MSEGVLYIPFERPELVGREEDLARVHAALNDGAAAITPAITGQGGVGKTQLAVLYAYEYRFAYPGGVFWLNCAEPGDLPRQMANYADQLRLSDAASCEAGDYNRRRAQQWIGEMRERSRALIIADNVEDDGVLSRDLPGLDTRLLAMGTPVLVTSRRRDLPGCQALPLDVLSGDPARDLLLKEAGREAVTTEDRAAADAIVALLGGLPLALRLAGAILKHSPADLQHIAEVLHEQGAIAIVDQAKATLEDYERSLRAVLAESWDAAMREHPELGEVMLALGCLGESALVPLALFRHLADLPADPLGLRDPLDDAIRGLHDRNLVERPSPGAMRLHPLIHQYTAAKVPHDLPPRLAGRAGNRLRDPAFLCDLDGRALLALAGDMTRLQPLIDRAGAAGRDVGLLKRCVDLQSHNIRVGHDPLPHLHRQAVALDDEALAAALEAALADHSRPWLRVQWSTVRSDPALLRQFSGHTSDINGCALSGDGRLALSASDDETLRLWDTETGEGRAVLEGHIREVQGCALSADGRLALSASHDKTLRLWDTETGEARAVLEGHTSSVRGCALSADGRLALSASHDETLRLWNTETGEARAVLEGHTNWVTDCALSADGRLALSASWDRTLRLWDTETGEARAVLEGHTDWVWGCALSADGRLALSASDDQTVPLWDTETGEVCAVLEGHTRGVQGCALSADGRLALSDSDDQTLRLWDTETGECLVEMALDGVSSATLGADGLVVLAGDTNGGVSFCRVIRP